MTAKVTIRHEPDFAKAYSLIESEIGSALVDGGYKVVDDMADRIHREVDLRGAPQKRNSEAYLKWKRRERGHSQPLRRGDETPGKGPMGEQLSDAFRNYRINDVEVRRRGTDHPMPFGPFKVQVKLPIERVAVAGWLTKLGYRLPFGVSAETKRWLLTRLVTAVKIAKGRLQGAGGPRSETSLTSLAAAARRR